MEEWHACNRRSAPKWLIVKLQQACLWHCGPRKEILMLVSVAMNKGVFPCKKELGRQHRNRRTDWISGRSESPLVIFETTIFQVNSFLSVALNYGFGSWSPSHPGCFIGTPPQRCTLYRGGKPRHCPNTQRTTGSSGLGSSCRKPFAAWNERLWRFVIKRRCTVRVTLSTSVTTEPKGREGVTVLDLVSTCVLFGSTSNLYATRVMAFPKGTETMQNATLILNRLQRQA